MIEKEFVPYQESLELKELGFDEPCFGYYDNQIKELDTISSEVCERLCKHDTHTKAPTYSQAFRWFRERYSLYSHIRESYAFDNTLGFVSQINGSYVNHGIVDKPINRFETYEEAELACLRKLIEIVKQK